MIDALAIFAILVVMALFITAYVKHTFGKKPKHKHSYKRENKYKKNKHHKHHKPHNYERDIDNMDKIMSKRRDEKRRSKFVNKHDSKDDLVYLDMTTSSEFLGRIVIKLFSDVVPHTCENFKVLCSNKNRKESSIYPKWITF